MDAKKRDAYPGNTVTFALESKAQAGEHHDIAWLPAKELARVPVAGDQIVIDSPTYAESRKDGPGGGHGTRYVVTAVNLGFVSITDENAPIQYASVSQVRVFLKEDRAVAAVRRADPG